MFSWIRRFIHFNLVLETCLVLQPLPDQTTKHIANKPYHNNCQPFPIFPTSSLDIQSLTTKAKPTSLVKCRWLLTSLHHIDRAMAQTKVDDSGNISTMSSEMDVNIWDDMQYILCAPYCEYKCNNEKWIRQSRTQVI